jgi:alpha-ribazole phosphatase
MKTLKIHLIRHGATDANVHGMYIGCKTDLPLSPEGFDELRLLRDNNEYPKIQKLYSSPMLRARQTVALLFPDTDITLIENMREYDFGAFEGKTAIELEGNPYFASWVAGKISAPEGESNTEFVKRICLGFNEIVVDMLQNNISEAAVVMHGGAMMMLLAACAVPQHKPVEWASDNGRGFSVLVTPSLYHKSGIIEAYDII